MTESNKQTVQSLIAMNVGILGGLAAIIAAAVSCFVYLDNTYVKKTPDEIKKVTKEQCVQVESIYKTQLEFH
ncbi:hypothetical protein QUF76_14985 [Desulfobacterales bacterium HSG16]|nr:hypothetical protein [Desulfobacterales bacterium HSG16]